MLIGMGTRAMGVSALAPTAPASFSFSDLVDATKNTVGGIVKIGTAEVARNAAEELDRIAREQRRQGTESIGQEIQKAGQRDPILTAEIAAAAGGKQTGRMVLLAGIAVAAWFFLR